MKLCDLCKSRLGFFYVNVTDLRFCGLNCADKFAIRVSGVCIMEGVTGHRNAISVAMPLTVAILEDHIG